MRQPNRPISARPSIRTAATDAKGKVWTLDMVKEQLRTNDEWLYKAIKIMFLRQTADEQRDKDAKYQNRLGFNGGDAKHLTNCAKWLENHTAIDEWHRNKARNMMIKYAGQVLSMIQIKAQQDRNQPIIPSR